jgi:hypothetical protein
MLDFELNRRPGRIGRPPLDRRVRLYESDAHLVSSSRRIAWSIPGATAIPLPRGASSTAMRSSDTDVRGEPCLRPESRHCPAPLNIDLPGMPDCSREGG